MSDGWKVIKKVHFVPGFAVGMVYLENPKNDKDRTRAINWFEANGINVDRSQKREYLLVKPSSGLIAAVNRYAKDRGHKSTHDAALELIQLGLSVAYPEPKEQGDTARPSIVARFIEKMKRVA